MLDILSRVFQALLYSMNLLEDEMEDAVAKIKEHKMGRMFENVMMDIQAERRNMAAMQVERDIYKYILRITSQHHSKTEILESINAAF